MRSNQDLVHGAARQPQVLGERSYTPAAVVLRLLADAGLHPQHHFLAIFYGSTGTRGILETLQTLVGKTTAPFADGHFRHLELVSKWRRCFANKGLEGL